MTSKSNQRNHSRSGVTLDWLFGKNMTPEEQERIRREEKIKDLLPNEEDEDAALGKVYDSRLIKRLFGYMTPYKSQLIMAIVLMTVTALLSVSWPWLIGLAIDKGIRTGSLASLRFWTII